MKIIKEKYNENESPSITVNTNGEIVKINESAKKEFKLEKKSNISKLVDLDYIKKMSMFSKKVDIFPIKSKKYKEGILRSSGSGLYKTITISFEIGYDKTEQEANKEQEMLTTLTALDSNVICKEFNCLDESKSILDALKQEKSTEHIFVNNYSRNETFTCNLTAVQAIALCAIALANEVSPKRPVDFSIKRILHLMQIEVKVRVDTLKTASCVQDIESIYPFTALRFALLDSVCENDKISQSVQIVGRELILRFMFTENKGSTALHSAPFYTSILPSITAAFAPRASIAEKYGIIALPEE